MSGVYRDYDNSLNMYQGGYQGWKRASRYDAKTYYDKLCGMVVQEYRMQGFCRLVDEMIEGKYDVEVITFHSLEAAGEILRGGTKKEAGEYAPVPIPDASGFRPTRHYPTWEDWTRYVHQYGNPMMYSYSNEIGNLLLKLRARGQETHLDVFKKYFQAEEKKEIQINNPVNDARSTAEQIVAKAREDALKIREEARIEAERIRSEVYSDAAKKAQSEEVSSLSKEAIQEYLKREREAARVALGKEYEEALDKSRAILGTAEGIHNEMCDQTNRLQASWVKALDKTVEELTAIKEDFYKRIHNWQVGLYPHELRPFAERYIELYRIVNVDKMIADELFRVNPGNNTDKVEREIYNTSPVLEELEKLNRKLSTFLKKFESSLNGLDMYVYHPESGEAYDEVWHVIEDDSKIDYSKAYRVARCILPGVAKKVNDDGEDDVIIPAVVEV